MRMTVLADAYLNRVTLKTRCPKHWQMLRYGHLRSDASSTTTTPVGFCQCARVKSVGVAWPEVLRDISQVDPNGQPHPRCDLLYTSFRVLLSKKADEVIAGHLFLDPQTGNHFIESLAHFIIAQSVKHLSGVLPPFSFSACFASAHHPTRQPAYPTPHH